MRQILDAFRARTSLGAETPDQSGEGLEGRPTSLAVRWNFILVWFMRMLALMWIAKGLGYWAVILGADNAPTPFEARSTGFQATTIYFASSANWTIITCIPFECAGIPRVPSRLKTAGCG